MSFIHPAGKAILSRVRQAGPIERFYIEQSSGYSLEKKAILEGREWQRMLGRLLPSDTKHGKKGIRE
jgi:hypothetical protein